VRWRANVVSLYRAVAHIGELLIGPTNRTDCKTIVKDRLTWGSSYTSGQSCPQKDFHRSWEPRSEK
jgi:hypothetical protein